MTSATSNDIEPPAGDKRLAESMEVLKCLQFEPRQRNETAAYTLLAMLDLTPETPWKNAAAPLRGITPVIEFIATVYHRRYAPNTRETIRDDAVKFFVEAGLLLRNPDAPRRPTNSGKTVYQVEPTALNLLRSFGSPPNGSPNWNSIFAAGRTFNAK